MLFNSGIQMAAAYGFKPNSLGRCGPANIHKRLAAFVRNPDPDQELGIRELLNQFEVLVPYCDLIAAANNISDRFDPQVVEAYFLGNELLDKVDKAGLRRVIAQDVQKWSQPEIQILFSALLLERAVPHHSLSVLYYLIHLGSKKVLDDDCKKRIDQCRVYAGQVKNIRGEKLVVEYRPLVFGEKITVGELVLSGQAQKGFVSDATIGDIIAFHLGFGIQKLTSEQAANLDRYTIQCLKAINGKK